MDVFNFRLWNDDSISEVQEKILWEKGLIGYNSAESLLNGVFFYNCKLFGIH